MFERFAREARERLALERSLQICGEIGDRRISNRHLIAAIASAEVGTTPVLLRELGTTAEELARLTGPN